MPFDPIVDYSALLPLLSELERARQEIHALEVPPMFERWLQRFTEARGAHMSTRIEGNPMTEQQVREAFARPPSIPDAAEVENRNYRDAVRFAQQAADDPTADIDAGLIRALHYQVVREVDRYGSAGQYRQRQNAIVRGGRTVYLPPAPMDVRGLMDDLVHWLRGSRGSVHPLVLAAVAHIEFINIHPFDDGNGRTARAITSYFLARGGWRLRGFVTAEQVFGQNIEAYYAALREFGDRYPLRRIDFTSWVRWFLLGLLTEAELVLSSVAIAIVRPLADKIEDEEWPARLPEFPAGTSPRLSDGILYLWLAGTVSSREYAAALDVSPATAVADLNLLVERGLVTRSGRARATRYVARTPWLDETIARLRPGIAESLRSKYWRQP